MLVRFFMRHRSVTLISATIFFFCLLGLELAYAGFGITPPYVRNTSLTRNSVYEQQIQLVRGSPDSELLADISVDAPEFASWIEIVEGEQILLPRGEQHVPMTVRVTVPRDVEFKDYSGRIRIRTRPSDNEVQQGGVSITLGAQVNINLTVIDRIIEDFRVRRISLPDLNEGRRVAWLYFPGRIEFGMRIENTGNVDISPSRVAFEIYDVRGQTLLEETEHIGRITRIKPYATEDVTAYIPTRLPAGNYIARYTIYNKDEVKQTGELNLGILEYGTLQKAGFGFSGLSLPHKISILLPILSVLIIIIYLGYFLYGRRRKKK